VGVVVNTMDYETGHLLLGDEFLKNIICDTFTHLEITMKNFKNGKVSSSH
jgi:hypothetical protein